MKPQDYNISSEKLKFRSKEVVLHDTKLETKPVSYLKDALNRFTKNKASIVAAFIIALLLLFALFGPLFTPYKVKDSDVTYAFALPKNELFYKLRLGFWDGCKSKTMNKVDLELLQAIEQELSQDEKFEVIRSKVKEVESTSLTGKTKIMYKARVDSYNSVGVKFQLLSFEEFEAIQQYQDRTGIQVLYPITPDDLRPEAQQDNGNGNFWFQTKMVDGKSTIVKDENKNSQSSISAENQTNHTSKITVEENQEKKRNQNQQWFPKAHQRLLQGSCRYRQVGTLFH